MSYVGIGNRQDYIADFPTQSFNGDGSTTTFTLNFEAVTGSVRVAVDNVLQPADGTAYYTNGNSITFTSAPATGTANITVTYLGTVRNVNTVSDNSISSSKIQYPLTGFESTGIDDNGTATAITIDSSGNVGIGSSSITREYTNYNQLNINGTSGATLQFLQNGTQKGNIVVDDSAMYLQNVSAMSFGVGGSGTGTERMRIDSSGLVSMSDYSISNTNGDGKSCGLNVNKEASDSCVISGFMNTTVDNRQLLSLYSNEVSSNNLQHIFDTDGQAYNRTGTWGTISSDERVKQDINPISSQWEDIKSLNLVNYKRKDEVLAEGYEAKKYIGVIAQQAEQVCPSLVKERNPRPEEIAIAPELGELEDDLDQPIYKQYRSGDTIPEGFEVDDYALDENGEKIITGYQKRITAIHDQVKIFKDSILFWKAVGALQEAQTKIETLESTVADLTARLETLENA